jgi:putative tricarboxylic transport membrane protein
MLVDILRKSLVVAGTGALCVALGGNAFGQQRWSPERSVEITVPNAPGGTIDRVARLIQKTLQDQKLVAGSVVVMNRPGGNQTIAGAHIRQFTGEPHQLLYCASTLLSNEITGRTKQSYRDLTPLALMAIEYAAVTVRADSPIKSMGDLIARLKADPESIPIGTTARGGPNDLVLAQAVLHAGIDPKRLRVAIFRSNPESLTALAGGHVQATATSAAAALSWHNRGELRIIAISAPKRQTGDLANVATMREQGIDIEGVDNFRGVFGTGGLEAAHVSFWEDALARVVETDEWFKLHGGNDDFRRSRDFAKYLKAQFTAYREVLNQLGFAK